MMRNLLAVLAVLMAVLTAGCDDTTEDLGLNLRSDNDIVESRGRVFPVEFENFEVDEDSIYTNSATGYLGKYSDDVFGDLTAGFMTQLYCQNGFTFDFDQMVKEPVGIDAETGDTIYEFADVTCYVNLGYDSFFGDSVNPCEVEVYRITRELTDEMTSSVDPEGDGFYDPETDFLGRVTYTAANTYIDEDERTEDRNVVIRIPDEVGQHIINLNNLHPEYFTNSTTFNRDVINGLYLKPTLGDGTMLYVNSSSLNINFLMYADSAGIYPIKRKQPGYTDQDSTSLYSVSFNSTREVYQVNTFANVMNEEVVNDNENTYIKSPAGIFTTVKLPVGQIAGELANDTILQMRLTLQAYNQYDNGAEIGMDKPDEVLLVPKDEVYSFFRSNSLPDNHSSYTTSLNTSDNTYVFENISALVVEAISRARASNGGDVPSDLVEEVVVLPVTVSRETVNDDDQITSVRNDLMPQYARLVKAGNKLEVSYISIGSGDGAD